MKIYELIEELKKIKNQEAHAVISGYEGGADDVTTVKTVEIVRDFNKGVSYYGDHEVVDGEKHKEDKKHDAVLIKW